MTDAAVRRIRLQEWREVRDIRIRALRDPAAPIAFLDSVDAALARSDDFWQMRAAGAAIGENAAQFVAVVAGDAGETWVGSVSVLLRAPGDTDTVGRAVSAPQADLVGVFVDADHRGQGVLDALVEAASAWAVAVGADGLTLEVHVDNARAQAAYRRLGFIPTGLVVDVDAGREIQMHRPAE
ncbi:GNAT family N-acetyltransferase [Microbacterium sp. MM2322]|uniref:GNAT family N-acetyltransferase n=1 Tax=Microbacterium sp. MM2322 TaxID=3157631 RepID=UPI0032D5805F